jgi:hypothetical protein
MSSCYSQLAFFDEFLCSIQKMVDKKFLALALSSSSLQDKDRVRIGIQECVLAKNLVSKIHKQDDLFLKKLSLFMVLEPFYPHENTSAVLDGVKKYISDAEKIIMKSVKNIYKQNFHKLN